MSGPSGPSKQNTKNRRNSGSPKREIRYLAIGKVTRAHGVRGELSVAVLTEFPGNVTPTINL